MKKKIMLVGALVLVVIILAGFGINSMTENAVVADSNERPVKEFTMTSFTEIIDGKYYPQYSEKELTVNKGDLVRIKITTTSGKHDFKIDEFNVYSETPLEEEVIIEFIADEAGEFIYWCTKPKHRENGHWGTLTVLE